MPPCVSRAFGDAEAYPGFDGVDGVQVTFAGALGRLDVCGVRPMTEGIVELDLGVCLEGLCWMAMLAVRTFTAQDVTAAVVEAGAPSRPQHSLDKVL